MWCKTDGEKEDRGPNGDVGIEGNRPNICLEVSLIIWVVMTRWDRVCFFLHALLYTREIADSEIIP